MILETKFLLTPLLITISVLPFCECSDPSGELHLESLLVCSSSTLKMEALCREAVRLLFQRLLDCLRTSATGIATDVCNLDETCEELGIELQKLERVRPQLEALRDTHGSLQNSLDEERESTRQLLSPSPSEGLLQLLRRSRQVGKAKTSLSKLWEEAQQHLKSTSLAEPELRLKRECDTSKPKISFGAEAVVNKVIGAIVDGGHRWIGLTGMGGIGKTFTARTVFNDPAVCDRFKGGMFWITVSKDNPPAHILLGELVEKISRSGRVSDFRGDLELAKTKVGNLLENHSGKVFLILDDVWERDIVDCLDEVLEEGQVVILVTTRNQRTLKRVVGCAKIMEIDALSTEHSWHFLSWYAFRGKKISNDLEGIAREVAGECKGLPLALRVIGATMRGKQVVPREELGGKTLREEWEEALQELRRAEIYENEYDKLYHRLQLSVNNLRTEDRRLVDCFCYFAAFPEDYQIDGEDLVEMWIAEGMVGDKNVSWNSSQKASSDLLRSLVVKFIVDEHRYAEWEFNRYYVIHDVMRDLARWNLKRDFDANHKIRTSKRKCLYEPGWTESEVPVEWTAPDVAGSYLWTAFQEWISPQTSGGLQAERLSLYNSRVTTLPNRFNAPHLRVLMLRKSDLLCDLPPGFFRYLSSLTVLDLSKTGVEEISDAVLRALKKLTLLNLTDCRNLRKISDETDNLLSLEVLLLDDCDSLDSLPRVGSLTKLRTFSAPVLRKFNMACDRPDAWQRRWDYLAFRGLSLSKYVIWELFQLPSLRRLAFTGERDEEVPLPDMSSLAALEELSLVTLEPLPSGMTNLRNLKVLRLEGENMSELPAVGNLPHLEELLLFFLGITKFPESFGIQGAFPSLKKLYIENCGQLEDVCAFHKGAMPKIERFNLTAMPTRLPKLLKSMTELHSLKMLEILYCKYETEDYNSVFRQPSCFLNLENLEICEDGASMNFRELNLVSLQNLKQFRCSATSREELPSHIVELERDGKLQVLLPYI